jgi:mannose-1-phosphate guanylyltransferase
MLHAVILAGGSGTRLWPESRADRPKQLLALQGDRTMIQVAVDRVGDLVALDRILVATTGELAPKIHEQLSHLPRTAILCEPCPRNTAPCIGLAAIRLVRDDPEAIMAVMPADQVIAPAEVFQASIRAGAALVEADPRRLVTYGILPSYPATTYGYIERGERLDTVSQTGAAVFCVRRFREKPDLETARQYLASGTFYWNSGIFVWKARTILEALAEYQPEIALRLERIAAVADQPEFAEVLPREFAAMPKISIDYAVMERSSSVVVIEAPFEWDDVGSWLALERHATPDENRNCIAASHHVEINATGNLVRVANPEHLVVLAGARDLVVVVTPDATLIADKHDEASIARITEEIRKRGWCRYL